MNAEILNDFERVLGWALLHFLWQGAVIAALLAVVLRMFRRAAPNRRYLAGCVALLLLGLAPVITAYFLAPFGHHAVIPTSENNFPTAVSRTVTKWVTAFKPTSPDFDFARQTEEFLPWVVVGWAVGVAAFSCRLAAGWLLVNRLRRVAATALDAEWHERLEKLKNRLGVTRPVRLLQSALLEMPSVIGWLKPVILLPAGCVAGLSPAQLESILAHELAHIRRHDYLVNLLQSILETFLFYHPAVWWVSRRVREERENCCDDLAVEACGNRMEYARALAALEEMRPPVRLALAANGSELLPRIRRLAGKTDGAVNRAAWPIAGIIALLFLAAFFFGWHRHLKTPSSSVTSSTDDYVHQSSGFETRTFHLRPDIFRPVGETAGSTNLNPSPLTSIIQFFQSAGVDWDTNNPTKTGKALVYGDRKGILTVRSTPRDLDLIERALTREMILQNHGASSVAPFAQMAPPPPPARLARTAGGATTTSEVTDTILAAQKQAAAASGRAFPPVPPPYDVPSAASVVDPQTGLPAEFTAAILAAQRQAAANAGRPFPPLPPPLEVAGSAYVSAPGTGLPLPAIAPARLDPQTGLPVPTLSTAEANPPAPIQVAQANPVQPVRPNNPPSTTEIDVKVKIVEMDARKHDPAFDGDWNGRLHDFISESTELAASKVELPPSTDVTTPASASLVSNDIPIESVGILPRGKLPVILAELKRRAGTAEIADPEVVTMGERQAQLQMVEVKTIVTEIDSTNSVDGQITITNILKTQPLPIGPVVDITPKILDDGEIKLVVVMSSMEFLGYPEPKSGATNAGWDQVTANRAVLPLTRFRYQVMRTDRTVQDGETIVLIGSPKHLKKNLLVFVTATLINPDGTRYHP